MAFVISFLCIRGMNPEALPSVRAHRATLPVGAMWFDMAPSWINQPRFPFLLIVLHSTAIHLIASAPVGASASELPSGQALSTGRF